MTRVMKVSAKKWVSGMAEEGLSSITSGVGRFTVNMCPKQEKYQTNITQIARISDGRSSSALQLKGGDISIWIAIISSFLMGRRYEKN